MPVPTDLLPEHYGGPAPWISVPLSEGETLEVLSRRTEEECFVRREGRVYAAACPQDEGERFSWLQEPETEWWLRTEVSGEAGWFEAGEAGVGSTPVSASPSSGRPTETGSAPSKAP